MRRRLRWGSLLAVALALPLVAQPPPDDEIPPGIVIHDRTSVQLVLVPVVVRDADGFRGGLQRKDFHLFVDERPIPVESFEHGALAPISLLVLQDLSGSMENVGKLDASRRGVSYFIERTRNNDEVALTAFAGGKTWVDVPFTSDRQALRETLEVWEGYGTTALYDAVSWLPHLSMAGDRMKRAALLITDGVDNASEIPPAEAREIVRRAQLPVYVLGLEAHAAPREGDPTFRYADLLRLLATATGGRYYPISEPEEVDTACAAILAELRHQYVLGFSVSGVGSDRYRDIRVEVRKRRSGKLIHRPGYQGTRPAAAIRGQ